MRVVRLDADNGFAVPLADLERVRGPVRFDANLPTHVRELLCSLGARSCDDAEVVITAGPTGAAQAVMERALRIGAWEQSQTHSSLLPYLREECAEFVEAVETAARAATEEHEKLANQALLGELADLYLQVLFHAEIARRRGVFGMEDVARAFVDKLRRRAPYLFDGTSTVVPVDTQERLWQEAKTRERDERI